MLSLTKSPVDKFIWQDHKYKLDLAFDTVLLYMQLQQDSSLDSVDKWEQSIALFFGKQKLPEDPKFYVSAFNLINEVITSNPYGPQTSEQIKEAEKESVGSSKPYDYVRDAGAIYASFFQQYRIDLNQERGKMHWTIFKALLDGLGKDTYFKRIIQIRTEDPSEYKDAKDKSELLDAQNYYAVDGYKSEKEREQTAFSDDSFGSMFDSLFKEASDSKKGGK